MISVSVIMPVYNEQEHLKEALESWASQTLTDKELICVDDGSTDNSRSIIEEYRERYPNISLLTQKRAGAGAARNLGIDNARGEFVCFLDADDFYIDNCALERLYNAAVDGNVFICAGTLQVYTPCGIKKNPVLRGMLQNGETTRIKYQDFQYDYQFHCYLFQREYLNRQHFRFPLYKRFQDPPFLVQALYFAKEFLVVPVEFYGYRLGEKVVRYTIEKTYDLFQGLLFNLRFADQYCLNELLELTLRRINQDYFKVLYDGLVSEAKPLLMLMFYADLIACKYGYVIEPLEALFSVKRQASPFPYEKYLCERKIRYMLPVNSKIVLYGAGKIGTQCYKVISESTEYELGGWIDKNKSGEVYLGQKLEAVSEINNLKFDYVLIAINDVEISNEVKHQLINLGVSMECIVQWNVIRF